jgi:hypothetical protein
MTKVALVLFFYSLLFQFVVAENKEDNSDKGEQTGENTKLIFVFKNRKQRKPKFKKTMRQQKSTQEAVAKLLAPLGAAAIFIVSAGCEPE